MAAVHAMTTKTRSHCMSGTNRKEHPAGYCRLDHHPGACWLLCASKASTHSHVGPPVHSGTVQYSVQPGSVPLWLTLVMVLHLWQMNSSDNLEGNLSTFALEMQETAFILDVATANSLVLIDELGRGYAHVSSPICPPHQKQSAGSGVDPQLALHMSVQNLQRRRSGHRMGSV